MLTERAEEMLETLWGTLVEEKKSYCDIGIFKEDEAVKELLEGEYIGIRDNCVTLTDKGREEAANCVRRHRLAERLFVDVLDIKGKLVHETSCKFEHMLHKGLDDNVCTLLGHPKTCPHGKSIPEGSCCRDVKRMPKKIIVPLTELDADRKARISHLETRKHDVIQKIIAIGALPNTEIRIIQKFPSFVFEIGKSQFAVDKELASCIYVRII